MVYICVICMVQKPPLVPLIGEYRQLLEAIISPTVNLNQLGCAILLACGNCVQLIETVVVFRHTAIIGVKHLKSLLASVQATLSGMEPDSLVLQIKKEQADDTIQVQSYVQMDIELQQRLEEKLQLSTELDIKMEPMTEEPECDIETDSTPLTVANETDVDSCQEAQTTNALATDEREDNIAIFTHRPANAAPSGGAVDAMTNRAALPQLEPDRVKLKKPRKRKPPGPYKCKQCYAPFADADKLKRHQERVHPTPEGPYICKICNSKCKNKLLYHTHVRRHQMQEQRSIDTLRADLYCAHCQKEFVNRRTFLNHMQCLHTGKEKWKFECDICGSMFPEKSRIYTHIRLKHLNVVKQYRCGQCEQSFVKQSHLRRHAASHVPRAARPPPARPHVCHLCAKAFTVKKSLTEHLSMHAGLRPHACPLCPATFTYSAALYTHNRLKHLKIKTQWKKKPKKKTEKKSAV